jgi:hypothetical protein
MRSPSKQAQSSGPSQRRLRVRGLLRCALAAPVLLSGTTLARAEVCDKVVGEAWLPGDGPVWLLNPVGFPTGLVLLLGGLALLLILGLRWIGCLGSALLLFAATMMVSFDLIPQHEIYLAAVREGCRSYRTDLMNVGLYVALAAAYAWLAHRVRQKVASR